MKKYFDKSESESNVPTKGYESPKNLPLSVATLDKASFPTGTINVMYSLMVQVRGCIMEFPASAYIYHLPVMIYHC